MADYSDSKNYGNLAYPVSALETSDLFGRCESIITPKRLISKHLKGVDLSEYSTSDLKSEIEYAINEIESRTKLYIYKVQKRERLPFDRDLNKQMVYMKTKYGPILSVEDLSVVSSNGEHIYRLPATWLEMGFAHQRQLNLIPILSIFGAAGLQDGQSSNAGLIFIRAINNFTWLPAFWTLTYTVGVSNVEGQVPIIINDVIGIQAAMELLSSKQNQNRFTSTSISQDGLSQQASSPGPQVYQARIDFLREKQERLLTEIKTKFSQKYFLSNI